MDATTLLKNDHEAVRQLFREFGEAAGDTEARRVLYRAIRQSLQTHSRIEEQVFYPAVMRLRTDPARAAVRGALEEQQVMDGLFAELDQLDPEDERHGEAMRLLRERVERHIADQEGALFEQARIHLTDERLERLGRDMALLRDTLGGESVGAGVPARRGVRA
jgi:Hemerythrin HHE cation binding domain